MLSDLMPILVDFPLGKDVVIRPLGDLHIGSKQFSEERWKSFKDTLGDKKIIIVGDMMDNGTKNSVTNVYDTSPAMMPSAQKEWLYTELEPFAKNIICGVGGNHERRSIRDVDTDPLYDVFCRLRIEERYRQRSAWVIARIGHGQTTRHYERPSYNIWVTHGCGGGGMIGAGLNRNEKYSYVLENADVLITGHTHKPASFPSCSLYLDTHNKKIVARKKRIVVCSSMMEYGGYPIEKMLTPSAWEEQEITLKAKGKGVKVTQE